MRRLSIVFALVGLGLLAWLVVRAGPERIWEHVAAIGWAVLALVPLSLLWLGPNTLGWAYAIPPGGEPVPLLQLFAIRLTGEAVNGVLPSGYLGGEPVKAALITPWMGFAAATSSIVVAKTAQTLALLIYALLGTALATWRTEVPAALGPAAVGVPILLALGVLVFGAGSASGLLGRFARWGRTRWADKTWLARLLARAQEVDDVLAAFYRRHKGRFALSTMAHLCAWLAGTLEVWVIVYWMGYTARLLDALVIAAFATMVKVGAFFIPASIGAYEAGTMLAARMTGLPTEAGLTIALVRRMREVIWIAVGLVLFGFFKPSRPGAGGAPGPS